MQRTRIKFCGIMRVEDAVVAAKTGVDAIGMVLHSNTARRISLDVAKQIVSALPPFVTPIGLFVDPTQDVIQRAVDELNLRYVQLHGNESPHFASQLRNVGVIKAVRVSPASLAGDLKPWKDVENIKGLLLETASTAESGGSGVENNWQAIRHAQQAGYFESLPPIIAAGGLTPENVAGVVQMLRPWAVDVSSGIESSKGIKSREKMEAFVNAVRSADSQSAA